MKNIGLIGVGLLGTALAERFRGAGFRVTCFDIDAGRKEPLAKLGAVFAESAAGVARAARRVVLSLPHSGIAATVIDEIAPVLRPEAIVIDTTTGDPDEMASFGARLAEAGASYLDATVGGSSKQARERDAIVVAGGDTAAFEECADLFAAFARTTFHVGPCGAGARMKLAMNLVLGLNRAALAEGLMFAQACGLRLEDALAVFQAGPAYSRAMDIKGGKMLAGDFTPEARLSQHLKDIRLIQAEGERRGARLPLLAVNRRLLEEAEELGFGGADNSAVIQAYRKRAG